MLELRSEPVNEISYKILHIMQNESGIKEIFENKMARLLVSEYSLLILKDSIPIGFINLVREGIDNVLFLDMGIIKKYRNKGYGLQAMKALTEVLNKDFIIGQTKKTNISSNKMANNIAALVYSNDKFNYYLFPASRKKEFETSDIYFDFINHCEENPKKQKVLKR